MKHPFIAFALGVMLATGGMTAAVGQPTSAPLAPVIERLEAEGYEVVDSYRSWLGRLVVISTRNGMLREVVLNRTTGAVLSDRLFAAPDTAAPSPAPDGSGSGTDGDGNDGRDNGRSSGSDGPDKGARRSTGDNVAGRS